MNDNMIAGPLEKQQPYQREEHLSDYLQILFKRKWIILMIFLPIVGGVYYYSSQMTPVYKTTAVINIDKQSFELVGSETKKTSSIDFFHTQTNLLSSRSLVAEVIKKFDLWRDNEIQDQKTVNGYLSRLNVEQVGDTTLLNVSLEGTSPKEITKMLNTHIDVAIHASIQMEQQAAEKAYRWIEKNWWNRKKRWRQIGLPSMNTKRLMTSFPKEGRRIFNSRSLLELILH